MLFSESKGRKVVSTSTADTVGKIDEFVVDPASHSILALALKKTDHGDTLRWPDITAFGEDAVTVTGAERLTEADEAIHALGGKRNRMLGRRVLSTHGNELGTIADVEFAPDSGIITAIHLQDRQVEGVRLIGIGSYAVVVEANPQD